MLQEKINGRFQARSWQKISGNSQDFYITMKMLAQHSFLQDNNLNGQLVYQGFSFVCQEMEKVLTIYLTLYDESLPIYLRSIY